MKTSATPKSKVRGVSWFAPRRKWRVRLYKDPESGKRIAEYFDDKDEAEKYAEDFRRSDSKDTSVDDASHFFEEDEDFEGILRRHEEAQQRAAKLKAERKGEQERLIADAREIVSAGLKKVATAAHPDVAGGSHDRMQSMNLAAQWLRKYIAREESNGQ